MKNIRIFAGCMALTLVLSACGADKASMQALAKPTRRPQRERQMTSVRPAATGSAAPSQTPDHAPGEELAEAVTTEQLRAVHIAEAAAAVPGVRSAVVVITGNTCIVGIVPVEEPPASRLLSIKQDVEKAVLAADAEITHAAITASESLFERIADMPDSGRGGM